MNYIEHVSQAYAKLEALPNELCPPSRSPSPLSHSRTDLLVEKVTEAVIYAGNDATNPKWMHVARALRMVSTSRLYRGVPEGVRVGEKRAQVDAGNYEWVLPDTVEQWEECEEKWKRRFLGPPAGEGQTSKYWPPNATEEPDDRRDKTPTKAELVRDKVMAWQSKVVHIAKTDDLAELNNATVRRAQSKTTNAPKKQSPIAFPVAKPSALVQMSKPANEQSSLAAVGKDSVEPMTLNPPNEGQNIEQMSPSETEAIRITDLSEMVSDPDVLMYVLLIDLFSLSFLLLFHLNLIPLHLRMPTRLSQP